MTDRRLNQAGDPNIRNLTAYGDKAESNQSGGELQ
jgi:hypothetical protein